MTGSKAASRTVSPGQSAEVYIEVARKALKNGRLDSGLVQTEKQNIDLTV